MIEYLIDSIDLNRIKIDSESNLKYLSLCKDCNKLPIPQYKSYKDQSSIYCKSCYLSKPMKTKHLIIPNQYEIDILEKVIIRCSNPLCDKEFPINSLLQMKEHEKECNKIVVFSNFNISVILVKHYILRKKVIIVLLNLRIT